jgi:hypothetical protein
MNDERPFDYLKTLIRQFESVYKNSMVNLGVSKSILFDCRIRNLTPQIPSSVVIPQCSANTLYRSSPYLRFDQLNTAVVTMWNEPNR